MSFLSRIMDAMANRAAARITAAGSVDIQQRIASANRWRETYNPLSGLTMNRAVSLREGFMRGDMADIQWSYFFIERSDPDLLALVERRTSAILDLDWDIRIVSDMQTGWDERLAAEQQHALRETYEGVDNLYEAIEHLAMASFRGYSHLEKYHGPGGRLAHLEPLDQWNVTRDGYTGEWKYNPDARSTTFKGLPDDNIIRRDDPAWIIRQIHRHIDWFGLVKFIRSSLSQKDWDGFVEIFGIPGCVVIGPPDVPESKQSEYEDAAGAVAEGGSGYLPNGADVKFSDSPRGVNPFRDHLRYQSEQLILAGTGGLLTMLTESGSGTLAGGAHQDTFERIARAEARKISEIFQRRLDRDILEAEFPGTPVLAYWQLSTNAETDTGEIVEHAAKLSSAGYRVDIEELSEKTGYTLEAKEAVPQGQGALVNRTAISNAATPPDALLRNAVAAVAKAAAADLQPLRTRLERILQIQDPEIMRSRLQALNAELPQLLADINADPLAARALEQTMAAAMANGLASRPPKNRL